MAGMQATLDWSISERVFRLTLMSRSWQTSATTSSCQIAAKKHQHHIYIYNIHTYIHKIKGNFKFSLDEKSYQVRNSQLYLF